MAYSVSIRTFTNTAVIREGQWFKNGDFCTESDAFAAAALAAVSRITIIREDEKIMKFVRDETDEKYVEIFPEDALWTTAVPAVLP